MSTNIIRSIRKGSAQWSEEDRLQLVSILADVYKRQVMGLRAQCSNTNIIPDMTPAILMAHYTVPGLSLIHI